MRLLKFASEVRAADDGVITAVLSTESVDRDGDIVQLSGWDLANFSKAPRLLSCHDYGQLTSQIGEWRNVRVDPERKALIGEAHYYTGQGNPEADWAYFLATQGQATYSVGFVPKASTPRKGANGGRVYTNQELLEVSHVPVPSQPDALQLMAKAAQWTKGARTKWDSQYMDRDDDDPWSPRSIHCLVAGCDDAAQTNAPICSEHLKYLMNADPEPPGSPPDDDDLLTMSVLRSLRRVAKAGKVISSANMGKLHSAMQSLSDVHDAACAQDDCPLEDGGSDEGPPTGKGAQQRAASENSGADGGDTTHPFDGTHTHTHSAGGDQGADATHSHAHTHANDSTHTSADHIAAHKGLTPDEVRALITAELAKHAQIGDSQSPNDSNESPATQFHASLEDAMTKALAALEAQ